MAGHSVAAYHDMTADELRDHRDYWREQVFEYAQKYRAARIAGDWAQEAGVGVALDQAMAQVRRLNKMLQLGVAA